VETLTHTLVRWNFGAGLRQINKSRANCSTCKQMLKESLRQNCNRRRKNSTSSNRVFAIFDLAVQTHTFNGHIALLFLHALVTLGGKKAELVNNETTNANFSIGNLGESTIASSNFKNSVLDEGRQPKMAILFIIKIVHHKKRN